MHPAPIAGTLTPVVKILSASTSVQIARLVYLLICELAGVAVALSTKGADFEIPLWVGIIGGLLLAGLFILIEALS